MIVNEGQFIIIVYMFRVGYHGSIGIEGLIRKESVDDVYRHPR
jgi:hypothetical protein